MAKLTLTDEEKAALSWLDISDDALGKLARKTCLAIMAKRDEENPDDRKQVWASAAAMLLCNVASDANAETLSFEFHGLTRDDERRGDWSVAVTKIS